MSRGISRDGRTIMHAALSHNSAISLLDISNTEHRRADESGAIPIYRELAPFYPKMGRAWCFVILAGAWGGRDQLHDLLDIFLHALKFSARQIELSPSSGNLGVGSDGRYVFHIDMNQFTAGFSQFERISAPIGRRSGPKNIMRPHHTS